MCVCVCVCTFQPGNFTGLGSERVDKFIYCKLLQLYIATSTTCSFTRIYSDTYYDIFLVNRVIVHNIITNCIYNLNHTLTSLPQSMTHTPNETSERRSLHLPGAWLSSRPLRFRLLKPLLIEVMLPSLRSSLVTFSPPSVSPDTVASPCGAREKDEGLQSKNITNDNIIFFDSVLQHFP